jgi:hypothetical protein
VPCTGSDTLQHAHNNLERDDVADAHGVYHALFHAHCSSGIVIVVTDSAADTNTGGVSGGTLAGRRWRLW